MFIILVLKYEESFIKSPLYVIIEFFCNIWVLQGRIILDRPSIVSKHRRSE